MQDAQATVRVLIVDDQAAFRRAARSVVELTPRFVVVRGTVNTDGHTLAVGASRRHAEAQQPDGHGPDGLDARSPRGDHMSSVTASPVPEHKRCDASAAGPLGLIRRHPVAALLVLTFGLTWLLEIPRALDARGELPFPFPFWALLLMGWMPGLAAIIVAATTGGRPAVKALFARVLVWKVGWPWYLLVIGGTAAIWLGAVVLNPVFGGSDCSSPSSRSIWRSAWS